MSHPLSSIQHKRRTLLWLLAATVLVILVFLLVGPSNPGVVDFELAWTQQRVSQILGAWSSDQQLRVAFGLGFDYLFMPLYSTTIALGCVWVVAGRSKRWRSVGALAAWGLWVAAAFDALENLALFRLLLGVSGESTPLLASICATAKFALIVIGLAFVVSAIVTRRGTAS